MLICSGATASNPTRLGVISRNHEVVTPATLSLIRNAMFDHMKAKGMFAPRWYALAPFARVRLQPLFARTGLDLSGLRFTANGAFGFLTRYRREWIESSGNPYGVPHPLRTIPIGQVDPVDGRFYLDQICDRFRLAAETGE